MADKTMCVFMCVPACRHRAMCLSEDKGREMSFLIRPPHFPWEKLVVVMVCRSLPLFDMLQGRKVRNLLWLCVLLSPARSRQFYTCWACLDITLKN